MPFSVASRLADCGAPLHPAWCGVVWRGVVRCGAVGVEVEVWAGIMCVGSAAGASGVQA